VTRAVRIGAFALVALSSAHARAQPRPAVPPPTADEARAETLFNVAKQLRDNGQLAEACPMFAESKRVAPGIGITLYLGDCYERMGRTVSAWAQYREAEGLARQKGDDKRADIARAHAHALEPKIGRLTMAAANVWHGGWQVQLDGKPVPPGMWNSAVAVDPIDHTVTINAPGKPPRTLRAHLDAGNLAATVNIDESAAAAAAGEPASTEPMTSAPSPTSSGSSTSTRTWAEIVLGGAGVVGLGLGALFLVKKNQSMYNSPASTGPTLDKAAAAASKVAFSVGGVALASAVVLYLTTPGNQSQVGVTIAPVLTWGGGGAVVGSSF